MVLVCSAKPQANYLFGLGVGASDSGLDFKNPPPLFYSDKDINTQFMISKKYFSAEARQGFKYDNFFHNYIKSSTYVLLGFTTPKEKRFSFDMLIGIVHTFMTNQKYEGKIFSNNYYYPSQTKPAIKLGFYYRLYKSKPLYLGLEGLTSPFDYYYNTGSTGGSGGISISSIISINYLLNKNNLR